MDFIICSYCAFIRNPWRASSTFDTSPATSPPPMTRPQLIFPTMSFLSGARGSARVSVGKGQLVFGGFRLRLADRAQAVKGNPQQAHGSPIRLGLFEKSQGPRR